MSNENTIIKPPKPPKLIDIKNEECLNKDMLIGILKISLIVMLVLLYTSTIIIFYVTGKYYIEHYNFTIIDNANYSYIEYISDFIFLPESKEKEIIDKNNSLCNKTFYYKKLDLSNYNKNIFCECTNKGETRIS